MAKHPYIIASVKSAFEAQDIDQNVYRKELVYPGNFVKKDPQTGDVEFNLKVDDALMDHWVATFQRMAKNDVDVPLPIEHTTDPERRRGTVVDLKKEFNPERGVNALYAYVKFRDPQTAATLSKTSQVSLFAPPKFSDGKGNDYTRPITHVALTDYPLVPGLSPFSKAISASLTTISPWSLSMEEPTMTTPMQQLAIDLGIEVGDEADDEVIAQMIRDGVQTTADDMSSDEFVEDPAVEDPMSDDLEDSDLGDESSEEDLEDPEEELIETPEEEDLEEEQEEPLDDLGEESLENEDDFEAGFDDEPTDEVESLGEEDLESDEPQLTNFSDLAEAMGIDVGDETDEQAIARAIIQAWNESEDDESLEDDSEEEAPVTDSPMQFEPDSPMAASMTGMIARSRKAELDALCREKKITPAVRDELIKQFTSKKQVAFAMSTATSQGVAGDNFDAVVAALSLNTPTYRTGERTGAQANRNDEGILVKDAERRSASAK